MRLPIGRFFMCVYMLCLEGMVRDISRALILQSSPDGGWLCMTLCLYSVDLLVNFNGIDYQMNWEDVDSYWQKRDVTDFGFLTEFMWSMHERNIDGWKDTHFFLTIKKCLLQIAVSCRMMVTSTKMALMWGGVITQMEAIVPSRMQNARIIIASIKL